jgi:hypothetical protein
MSISSPYLAMTFGHDVAERPIDRRPYVVGGQERRDLSEVALETCGGDDLERSSRLIGRVPEGVRHSPGLEDQVSWVANEDFLAYLDADLTL